MQPRSVKEFYVVYWALASKEEADYMLDAELDRLYAYGKSQHLKT